MPEETSVVDGEILDGKVSTEEDSETSKDSRTKETEGQETSKKDENTDSESESQEESSDDEVKDDGNPIPYERFKKVIEQKNKFKTDYETVHADYEEMAEVFKRPAVLRAILESDGITDPKVLNAKMKEYGIETKEEIPKNELFKQLTQGEDLKTQQGWFNVMEKMFNHFSKQAVAPLEKKFTDREKTEWVNTQEKEAQSLAKDVFGIEYGKSGKDEGNPNTAVGKISTYLDKHPEHANLGHPTILRLAMSEEGFKLGEQKGVQKEKERHKKLKNSAMEDDNQVVKEGTPTSNWSTSEILAWRRKNAK